MTSTDVRHAVPNLTRIPTMLHHEERITRLERENERLQRETNDLRQSVDSLTEILNALNCRTYRLANLLRVNTAIDIAHNDRLTALESRRGIRERIGAVELGGELP